MNRLSTAELGLALHSALVDRLTARVSRALSEGGIEHVLLKGPSIARWLYGPDELRGYTDSDLLVARWNWDAAVAVLQRLGFVESLGPMAHPRMESFTSHAWRGPAGEIDLHATLHGVGADWTTVWRVLSTKTETMIVDDVPLQVLSEAARLMHLAIHAGQHQSGWALDDLRRGLERAPEQCWHEAAALARRLSAEPTFASGLRVIPEGAALAGRLGVLASESTQSHLRASQVPLAEGLQELLRAHGPQAKASLLRRELAPTRAFMQWWSPLARRGPAGLALSYLWRPVYLARLLPAAVREVRRARRLDQRRPES